MQWNIKDIDPTTKARIKARAALHNHSISQELSDMEAIVTNVESALTPDEPKPHAKQPLQVNPKSHNYS